MSKAMTDERLEALRRGSMPKSMARELVAYIDHLLEIVDKLDEQYRAFINNPTVAGEMAKAIHSAAEAARSKT